VKTIQLGLSILLFSPIALFGRLGETEQQLTARFGTPVQRAQEIELAQGKVLVFGESLTFKQKGWSIVSVIIEGKCTREVYIKSGDWTQEQLSLILSSNAQGESWFETSQDLTKSLTRKWHRSDGADATWLLSGSMVVTHPAYERAKKNAADRAKADAAQLPNI
jgi:hypothetical protein